VPFVVDDLLAWLVGLLADEGRKKMTTWIFGDEQTRALRPAATEAVRLAAAELCPDDAQHAEELAIMIDPLFKNPVSTALLGKQATVLEALQMAIAEQLKVLDSPPRDAAVKALTGRDVPAEIVALKLASHLVHEITFRGARGGPLIPLANQLNQDMNRLQDQKNGEMLTEVLLLVRKLANGRDGPQVPRKPVRLAPRPVLLAGRETLLADLDTMLAGGGGPGPRIVALSGLGGAGKSSVAVEYAYRHLGEVGVAWQFAAEDATVLAAGFAELAAQLGAPDVADAQDQVASVHAVLAASPAGWLLMFDNAPKRAAVERFLPPAGTGRALITSRNPDWPRDQALEVPVLDLKAAAGFLVARTGDGDEQAATELADELGGLPLALEQAAAYIQASGDSLAAYLSLFRARRADLLARGEPIGHSETVATTWRLAFETLLLAEPDAVALLRLLANCAPEAIPIHLLLQPRAGLAEQLPPEVVPLLEDELAAKDAIAGLRRYSLISPPAVGGSVSVHRLVQAVTLDQMPKEVAARWRQATAAVIEAAIPDDPQHPGTWTIFAALLPHAQAALAGATDGMQRIASYVGFSGSYAAARDLQQRVFEVRRQVLGPEHPDTLEARANLAHWTGDAGDAATARDQFGALAPVMERVLGPEHPATLADRASLARWTGEAGDAPGARDLYAALMPVIERVLGPEHPDILGARSDLARWTATAGDAATARDQFAALVPVMERVLGHEHLDTLEARINLAEFTGEAGSAATARDQFAALVPVMERVLGHEHPGALASRANLAEWTGEAGDAAGARDQLAALVPVMERVSGPEHPYTFTDRANLAYWTGEAGDAATARDQFAALVPIRERVSGPEHPDTLTAKANLARLTGEAGDAATARDQFAALVPIRERVSGPEHPDTLADRASLAAWTGEAGDASTARDQFAALLPLRERVLGPEHPDTLTTRRNLAYWTEHSAGSRGSG